MAQGQRRAHARHRSRPSAGTPHRRSRSDVEAAFRDLLTSLGASLTGELAATPRRAASLWLDHLLAGEGADLQAVLGATSRSTSTSPVSLFNIGVHLVCPHHLTIAFGQAHVAYVPNGRIVGFGALARLVGACAARLSLQENVTDAIAEALVEHLGARAAVAVIEAVHPCHNVLHPRSHRAHAVTWALKGSPRDRNRLGRELRLALRAAGTAR